jgi:hypothetical protein
VATTPVTDRTPQDNATGVPLTTVITATFSERVDVTRVDETTFRLGLDHYYNFVPGTVSVASDGLSATFTPAAPLLPGRTYVPSLSGMRDMAGQEFGGAWTFRTAD